MSHCSWAMVISAAMYLAVIPSAGDCPATCECKWKSGKESVLCEGRNLTTVPQHLDSGTQLLDMSHNNLTEIREDEFSTAQLLNLQKVFLSRCSLRNLHRHAFRNLINLVDLDLSHNLLQTVPSHTFRFIPLLTELKLNGNPILNVKNHSFSHVPQLNKLDLSDCRITRLEASAFSGLENSLEWLKLSNNRLTNIRSDSVMILGNLKGLELAGNPWNCSCALRPLREWVLRHNIPHTISPGCRYPPRIEGQLWDRLDLDDLACLPSVTAHDPITTSYEGENVTMSCVITSIPLPTVKWLRKEKMIANMTGHPPIPSYTHFFLIQVSKLGSNLTIKGAELTDSGEYTCRAENRAGRAEARINLTINVRPAGVPWSARVVIATAVVILLFSLAAVLLLICVCCLWRKQHRGHPHVPVIVDSYEMNHKTPNSYEKINYATEVKIDETKGRSNGYIGAAMSADGGDAMMTCSGDRPPPTSTHPASPDLPDLHIPPMPDLRYKDSSFGRTALRLSPAAELIMSTPGVKAHIMRKEVLEPNLSCLYTSCNDSDNYPDLLDTDRSTMTRRTYRARRPRAGSFGSESLSPLLQGSSDESCDGTPMPLLDIPDPYPELDKFLKEYRNLQEQLYKMKESCENLKQDNLRFKAECGGEPKTISRLMDEVYKTGEVEPMYSVVDPVYNPSQHLLNDSLGNVLLSASNPLNDNLPISNNNLHVDRTAKDDPPYWHKSTKLLNTLSESSSNPNKSYYES